ncbi:MAG: dihydropteroate synthase [Spirochaetes bacterium]|nr:dihydropteroate synthase [Spirochaetota bacterium]
MSLDQSNFNVHVLQLNNEFDIRRELYNIKTDKKVHDILIQKMIYLHVKLEQVDTRAANLLKRQMHSIGGEAVISKDAYSFTERTTDVILSASKETLGLLAKKIINLPYGLSNIAKEISKNLFSEIGIMKVAESVLDFKHKTYIMGILKFFKHYRLDNYSNENLLETVDSMQKAGVDIIDIVEENHFKIYDKKEEEVKLSHLIPLVRAIKNEHPKLILSLTTGNYNIAKECLEAGIDVLMVGMPLKYYEQMLYLVAKKKCPIILMHSSSMKNKAPKPLNSISDVIREIQSNISYASGLGIRKEKIIIEPGIGFGRSNEDNFLILRQLSSFQYLNVPILVGLPKKSFLGEALRGKMRKTHISTIAANTMAIINGANIIRVDDVEQAVAMVTIIDTIRHVNTD